MSVPAFVLAANDSWIVGVIFLVITLISVILNAINSRKQPAPPPQRRGRQPARPRDERLANEIDAFLREIAEGRRPPKQERPGEVAVEIVERTPTERREVLQRRAQQRRPQTARAGMPRRQPAPPEIEIVSEPQPRAPLRPMPARESASPAETAPGETVPTRPGSNIAQRKLVATPTLGSGVSSHLSEYMSSRIESQVGRDLLHAIPAIVQQHLGPTSSEEASAAAAGPSKIIQLLQNKTDVRRAILLNEILSPPKALQKR